MTTAQTPIDPVVRSLVTAINNGDRAAFLAAVTPDAVLIDDGTERGLTDWVDREIFMVHGHLTVENQDADGLRLTARYCNDTWGEMRTSWTFHLSPQGDKISRIETSQA